MHKVYSLHNAYEQYAQSVLRVSPVYIVSTSVLRYSHVQIGVRTVLTEHTG